MPGLRYGPDITDDAEIIRKSFDPLKKAEARARKGNGPKLTTRENRRLTELRRQITAGFGNEKTMRQFSKYSLAKQGYDESGKTKNIAGMKLRARPPLAKGMRRGRTSGGGLTRAELLRPKGYKTSGRKRAIANAGQRAQSARKKAAKKAKAAQKKVKKATKAKPAKKVAKKVAKARPAKKAVKRAR